MPWARFDPHALLLPDTFFFYRYIYILPENTLEVERESNLRLDSRRPNVHLITGLSAIESWESRNPGHITDVAHSMSSSSSFLDSLGWLPLSLLLSKVMIISIPLELENLGADDI